MIIFAAGGQQVSIMAKSYIINCTGVTWES